MAGNSSAIKATAEHNTLLFYFVFCARAMQTNMENARG